MSFSSTGLEIRRFEEIRQELATRIKAQLGDVDTSEGALIGHLHSGLAFAFAELWEATQGVYDSTRINSAEGEGLDNLAILAGKIREAAKQTIGTAYFEGADGADIALGSRISSVRGDIFITRSGFTISPTNSLQSRLYVGVVKDAQDYRVELDQVLYSFTSGVSATEDTILTGLEALLTGDAKIDTTLVIDAEDSANSYILIDKISKLTTMSLAATTYLSFDFVVTPALITSEEFGAIPGDALAVNNILDSFPNLYTVWNPSDLTLGAPTQTDEALRKAILDDFTTVGSGTPDSIVKRVTAVENVAAAFVIENTTEAIIGDLPPKSYEVVVHEGNDEEIAEAIWATKPAGIHLHKDPSDGVELTIKDFNGYDQNVRFSRPAEKFVFIKVLYDLYGEEVFETDAEDTAKLGMLQFANDTLAIDDDIIAKRFLGALYGSTTGFADVTITVAYKDDPLDIPDPGDYADVLTISQSQISSFATDRMFFTAN